MPSCSSPSSVHEADGSSSEDLIQLIGGRQRVFGWEQTSGPDLVPQTSELSGKQQETKGEQATMEESRKQESKRDRNPNMVRETHKHEEKQTGFKNSISARVSAVAPKTHSIGTRAGIWSWQSVMRRSPLPQDEALKTVAN